MKSRTGQVTQPIGREAFAERFRGLFFDPGFRAEDAAIGRLQTSAWDNHQKNHKAPLTREAGPGFSDPASRLSMEWLEARDKIEQAQRRQRDPSTPSRVLLVSGTPSSNAWRKRAWCCIQALFGFQLVAVFSDRFDTVLGAREQAMHLAAVVTIAMAIVLIMTPAAYHRRTQSGQVSEDLLRISSRLVNLGLVPLAAGLAIDLFVVAYAITAHTVLSAAVAGLMAAALVGLWFAFPARAARKGRLMVAG